MPGTIRVRPARSDDLAAVLDLLAQLHPERPEMPGVDDARSVWAAMLAQPHRVLFVAQLDGVVVGTADLFVVPNLTRNARPWSIVENVVVDEAARRQGVGRALMTQALASARAAGVYKVQLISAPDREAHAFYETLGFDVRADGFRKYL